MADRIEAFPAHYFEVELRIPGFNPITGMAFRSCSGLKSEATVVELEEGGFNGSTRKLIGRTKFPNLVLKQGFANGDLFKLRKLYMNDAGGGQILAPNWGSQIRMAGIITQKGPTTANGVTTMAKWGFVGGWICKWEGPDFDATKNEISIESIEIAHEGLELLKVT
jgi:phage tail-like protein